MRPSGVASGLNSLKSWASKLHPQGPLTNQESTQLLNALTGAFRQKLDEAHPRNAHDDPNHPAPSHAARKAAGAVHSSAAHTDKHLASVLTSPLLGGRVLDYGTAKSELIRHPHRDSIEILEEYHQKGAASVPIAELCLSHVKQSIERLHRDRQQDSIARIKPGSRVFKWFLESQIHNVPSYVDNATFIEHLAFFLFKEGHEEHIWSWVQLDIANTDEIPRDVSDHPIKVATALNFRKYRWRARLLRGLISAKLGPIDSDGRDPGSDGMNAAFDAVFRICEMKRSQGQIDHLRWISVGPVKNLINWILSRDIHVVRRGLDVTRFERYYKLLPEMIAVPPLVAEFERARLRLVHPQVSLGCSLRWVPLPACLTISTNMIMGR